jgi:hypothetical protein
MRFNILIIGMIIFTNICHAKEINGDVKQIILNEFPGKVLMSLAVGDIEEKSLIAVIVYEGNLVQLVLLDKNDRKLVDKSMSWGLHERHSWNVAIKYNSIFISVDGSGGCCAHYFYSFQFKRHEGVFKLIGVETQETGFNIKQGNDGMAIAGEIISYKNGLSINYLSSKALHWRIQGNSSEKAPLEIINGKKRMEKTVAFDNKIMMRLRGFSYWGYLDLMENTKSLVGQY